MCTLTSILIIADDVVNFGSIGTGVLKVWNLVKKL